jgi:hypothetical protein
MSHFVRLPYRSVIFRFESVNTLNSLLTPSCFPVYILVKTYFVGNNLLKLTKISKVLNFEIAVLSSFVPASVISFLEHCLSLLNVFWYTHKLRGLSSNN